MLTLADYTRPLRPHIPLSLASDEAFERILTLTSYFPASLANNVFVLEAHLRADEPFVDAFVFFPEGQLPALPAGRCDQAWQVHPEWEKIRRFFSEWCEPTSLLHEKTDQAWLSFDLNRPVPELPVPGVFYCSTHPEADLLPTVRLVTNIFRPADEAALITENLARCLQHLPGETRVNHLGYGLLRTTGTLRLQVLNFAPQEIPAYLAAIGWDYSSDPLLSLLTHCGMVDLLSLMFDISTSIHPKIGLEFVVRGYDSRWQTILDYLVEQGLCDPDKRDFLAVYPGTKLCQMGDQVSLTRQRLSHVKIGYDPQEVSRPCEAKAYLAYYPTWLSVSA